MKIELRLNIMEIKLHGRRLEEVDKAARSLKVLGYGDGRRIPLFLQSVPAHYIY